MGFLEDKYQGIPYLMINVVSKLSRQVSKITEKEKGL